MPPLVVIPPEKLAQARRLYERTDTPVALIAAILGLPVGAFYWRLRHKWRWIRRQYHLPRTLQQRRMRARKHAKMAPD